MQWFDSSVFVNECQWQHDWRRPLRPWFKLVTDWMSWRTDITISIAHLILQTHTNVNDEGDEDSVNDQNVHKASQWQCELRLKPLAVLHVLTLWRIRRNMKKPSHSTPIQTFMLWCRPITCVAVAHDLLDKKPQLVGQSCMVQTVCQSCWSWFVMMCSSTWFSWKHSQCSQLKKKATWTEKSQVVSSNSVKGQPTMSATNRSTISESA